MAHEYLEGPLNEEHFDDELSSDGEGAKAKPSRSSLPHWTEPPTGEIPTQFKFRPQSQPEVIDLASVDQGALNWLHERRRIENNNGIGDVARQVFEVDSDRRGRHFANGKRASVENVIDLDQAAEPPSGRHFSKEEKRRVVTVSSSNLKYRPQVEGLYDESNEGEEAPELNSSLQSSSNSKSPFDSSKEPDDSVGEAFSDILRSKREDSIAGRSPSSGFKSDGDGLRPGRSYSRSSSSKSDLSRRGKLSNGSSGPASTNNEDSSGDNKGGGGEFPISESTKKRSLGSVATRIATGLALGAVVVICFLLSPIAVLVLLSAAVSISTGEFLAMVRDRKVVIAPDGRKSVETTINTTPFIAIPASVAVIWFAYFHGASSIIYTTTISLVFLMLWYTFGFIKGEVILNVAVNFFAIVWIGVGSSFIALIIKAQPGSKVGMAYAMSLLLATVSADTFAYFGGRVAGRHKLAPDISPGKTIAGYIIGLAGSILVGALISSRIHPMTVTLGVVFGAVAGLIGPVGDLIESKIKRELGAKDAGFILPGHGGFLDRIDSLIFVAPIIYFILFFSHHIKTFF